jgi:hypothetical protein
MYKAIILDINNKSISIRKINNYEIWRNKNKLTT